MSYDSIGFRKKNDRKGARIGAVSLELKVKAKLLTKEINQIALDKLEREKNNNLTEEERIQAAEMSRANVENLLEKCKLKLTSSGQDNEKEKKYDANDSPGEEKQLLILKNGENKNSTKSKNKSEDKENILLESKTRKRPKLLRKRRKKIINKKSRKGTPRPQKVMRETNKRFYDSMKASKKSRKKWIQRKKRPPIKLELKKGKKGTFKRFLNTIILSKQRTDDKILEFEDMQSQIQKRIEKLGKAKSALKDESHEQSRVKNHILDSVFAEDRLAGKRMCGPESPLLMERAERHSRAQRRMEQTRGKIDHINGFLVQLSKEREQRRNIKQERERSFFKKLHKKASERKLKDLRRLELAEKVRQLEKKKNARRKSAKPSAKQNAELNVRYLRNESRFSKKGSRLPSVSKRVNFPENMRTVQEGRRSLKRNSDVRLMISTVMSQNGGSQLSRSLIRGSKKLPSIRQANASMNQSRARNRTKTRGASSLVRKKEVSYREMYLRQRRQRRKQSEDETSPEDVFNDIEVRANVSAQRQSRSKKGEWQESPEKIEETINDQIEDILAKMKSYRQRRGTVNFNMLKQRIVQHLMQASRTSQMGPKEENKSNLFGKAKMSAKKHSRMSSKRGRNNLFR